MLGPETWPFPREFLSTAQARKRMDAQPRRPPDPSGERGVVLLPAWRNAAGEMFRRREAEYSLLRKALLYWDFVCWPQISTFATLEEELMRMARSGESSIIDVPEPELRLLREEGVLSHYPIVVQQYAEQDRTAVPTVLTAEMMFSKHIDAFMNLELNEPGCWSISEASDRFVALSGLVPTTEGVIGRLTNILPAPQAGVGYRHIIQFRRKHRQKLLAMRSLLDELAALIGTGTTHGYQAAVARLDVALTDVWHAVEDDRAQFGRVTAKIAVACIEGSFHGLVAGELITPMLPMPQAEAAAAAALAGAAAMAGVELAKEKVANPRNLPGAAAYLYPYLREAEKGGIVTPPL
jgi:hypothetical protein